MKKCLTCDENITFRDIYYYGPYNDPICEACYYEELNRGFKDGYNIENINDYIDQSVME